jgi:hypothetical protein
VAVEDPAVVQHDRLEQPVLLEGGHELVGLGAVRRHERDRGGGVESEDGGRRDWVHVRCSARPQSVTMGLMMRTQYYTATSIDGCIADQHNSLEWLFQAESKRGQGGFNSFLSNVGAFAMGATSYEWVIERHDLLVRRHDGKGAWARVGGRRGGREMKILNVHERTFEVPPERLAALLADFGAARVNCSVPRR